MEGATQAVVTANDLVSTGSMALLDVETSVHSAPEALILVVHVAP